MSPRMIVCSVQPHAGSCCLACPLHPLLQATLCLHAQVCNINNLGLLVMPSALELQDLPCGMLRDSLTQHVHNIVHGTLVETAVLLVACLLASICTQASRLDSMCPTMGCCNERAGKLAIEALQQIEILTCLMFAAISRQWWPLRPRGQSCLAHPRIVPAF